MKARTRLKTSQSGLVGRGLQEQNMKGVGEKSNGQLPPRGCSSPGTLPFRSCHCCPCALNAAFPLDLPVAPSSTSFRLLFKCHLVLYFSWYRFPPPTCITHLHVHLSLLVSLSPMECKLHPGRGVCLSCMLLSPQSLAHNRSLIKFC